MTALRRRPPAGRFATRPRWWFELAFIMGSYLLYSAVRSGVPEREAPALARAVQLAELEHRLGIAVEQSLNIAVAGVGWLVQVCNYFYATAHFAVTIGLLVWLYRRHPTRYRGLRTVLYAANLVALVGFWLYPLAPPRMLVGYVDTVVHFRTWGSWGSGAVASASNQFAAMPSMHIGWALWCGIVLHRLGATRRTRMLGVVYPGVTLFVIVATANHFVLDAVGGAAALGAGFGIQRLLSGRPALPPSVPPEPRTAPAADPLAAAV